MEKESKKPKQEDKSKAAMIEEEILDYWDRDQIFKQSVESRPENKPYVFYDGPPFATGTPHYGHILGSTSKDMVSRYWTMKGFRVERVWGWDCHGLPIENIVEKELEFKNKSEISEYGVGKFNEFCRSKVLHYADEWEKVVRRIGRWVEFKGSYKTMDNSYIESIWWAFKEMHKKGLVYEAKRVLLFCPRCETPLSNAEVAMDNSYQDVTEASTVAKFQLKDEPGTFILAWTTTPWTLIGNLALAVNKDLDYIKVAHKQKKDIYILAKGSEERILGDEAGEYEVQEQIKGADLLGRAYEPLYDFPYEGGKKGWYVIDGGDEVVLDEGTGVVHMAMYGEFDNEMVKKYDLPDIQHISPGGKLVWGPKDWLGMWFKKVNKKVLDDLDDRGLKFKDIEYTHSYPFCHRCNTPLFYNAVPSWFINVQKVKDRMIELNKDIQWHPSYVGDKRFSNILIGAPDWNVSRNRYWASAIPVWKCPNPDCARMEVIGSVEELRQKAVDLPDGGEVDLHKHVLDNVYLSCEKCGQKMRRVAEVFDCWLESGSMPFAQWHYPFENKEKFETHSPCQFVSEYIAQTRTWFYYMLAVSVMLFDKIPFEHVVVTGTIMAEDGTKMSKSKGNFPDPSRLINRYGVDALRCYLMSSPVMQGESINFNEKTVEEMLRKVVMLVQNVANFYKLFEKDRQPADKPSDHILDRWIMARLHQLIKQSTECYDNYEVVKGSRLFAPFIDDLSTWYVRRSRDRCKAGDQADKQSAINTLYNVLETLCRLMAPLTPFLSEHVYRKLGHGKSVHLQDWPEFDQSLIDEKLLADMSAVRKTVESAHALRVTAGQKVRQPMAGLRIKGAGIEQNPELLALIAQEVNVKAVSEITGQEGPGWISKTEDGIELALNTALTPELLQEGLVREIVRNINGLRKKSGLTIEDRAPMKYRTDSPELADVMEKYKDEIMPQVLASSLELSNEACEWTVLKINGMKLEFLIFQL